MKFTAIVLIIFLISCDTKIKYPNGGYNYPEKISDRDSVFYVYPIKHLLKKREIFRAYYDNLIYRPFNEPNLSLRAMDIETFRLVYATAFGETKIVILKYESITIKEGNPSTLYGQDTSRLTQIENYLLKLLNSRYPIDTTGKLPRQKKYLDSMVKKYPQLLDPVFYHGLFEKVFFIKDDKFDYKERKVKLSKKEYNSLIKEINSAGFWTMPHTIECDISMTDGDGFTLEANTKNKWQMVTVNSCSSTEPKFRKVCKRILAYAKGTSDDINR